MTDNLSAGSSNRASVADVAIGIEHLTIRKVIGLLKSEGHQRAAKIVRRQFGADNECADS